MNDWGTYENYPTDYTIIVTYNSENQYNGQDSITIAPHTVGDTNTMRECNSGGIPCNEGDRLQFTMYIKTTASEFSENNNQELANGARIGIDFYAGSTFTGIGALTNGVGNDDIKISGNLQAVGSYVAWNTTTWTGQTIDCIVPEGYDIDACIAWLQTTNSSDIGAAYFGGSTFYVTPALADYNDVYGNVWSSNILLLGAITISAGIIYKVTERWHQY